MYETDPVKITSTTRNFRVNLQTNFFDYFETWGNVQTSLVFTNATGNFAYTFVSTDGSSITACLNVKKRASAGSTLINETCVTAASGTILTNVLADVDDVTYLATGFLRINPDKVTNQETASFVTGYQKWGKDGILASFFVRMALTMIGIWNPLIALILLILADVGMIYMGLYYMSPMVLSFYVILAAITIYRVNRK